MISEDNRMGCIVVFILVFLASILIALGMWAFPTYAVYHQRKEGEAELARATSNRTIQTLEAHAKYESAIELAKADTVRAHGVATANAIIGQSLKGNEAYLTWLYIENLKEGKNDVIYIPTEAGLPILEAGKLSRFGRTARDSTAP